MKVQTILLGLVVALYLFSGCVFGSGRITSESREVSEFSGVILKSQGNVTINEGETFEVVVTTDDNMHEFFDTKVDANGRLIISKNFWMWIQPSRLNINITTPSMNYIILNGAGNISSTHEFSGNSMYIGLSGAGNISAKADVINLDANLSGAGNITITGTAENQSVNLSGAGNYKAFSLMSSDGSISLSGAGNCEVNVSTDLDVYLSGFGDVKYRGYPAVSKTVTGFGSVRSDN